MKIQKYKRNELPQEELEALTRDLIQAKIRDDYKNKWKKKLREEQGIQREVKEEGGLRKMINLPLVWKVAAAILLLALIAIPIMYSPVGDAQNQALALIDTDVFVNKEGGKKGLSLDVEENRQQAARYFNQQRFAVANELYLELVKGGNVSQSDCFYLAYGYLKEAASTESVSYFYQARQMQTADNYLREEINWYLSLALLADGKLEDAQQELMGIKRGEWKYSSAQKLLGSF